MTIGPDTKGCMAVDKDYPYEEGLTAETTKQTGNPNLEEEGSKYL
ncbi:MAG: hypothetical protein ACTSQE_14735 [Candidatus Heimdallarchaeaceae archaeon]